MFFRNCSIHPVWTSEAKLVAFGCGFLSPVDTTNPGRLVWRTQGVSQVNLLYSLLVIVILALPAQATAASDDLTPRQLEIIQTVLSVEGFITERIHSEFWTSVPARIREEPETREAFVRFIDRSIAAGVRFQRESWASMQESLKARRVVKTPGYMAAKEAALSVSQLRQFKQQAQKAADNAEGMIRAAAEGKPFYTPRGPMYITPELVSQVLAGLDGSVARFRRLTNPDWQASVSEYRYPDAHVAILSSIPFSAEKQSLTLENRRTVRATTLTNRLNETDYVGVTFSDYGGVWSDPDGAVIRTAKATLKGIGAESPSVSSSLWRGRRSAFGSGLARTSEGVLFTSTRVVEMREVQGALIFIAVTATSKVDAEALREQLERSTQILR